MRAPPDVLAMTEVTAPEPPERPALLERAAALNAPLPPARPASRSGAKSSNAAPIGGISTAPAKVSGANAAPARAVAMASASPYGGLMYDAFTAAEPGGAAGQGFAGLRGSTP